MRQEILTKEQTELLDLVKMFFKDFGLVGGTAIALHLGHRESIDFDLFSDKEFNNPKIRKKILKIQKIEKVFTDEDGQYTLIINGVQFTFFYYPFKINFSQNFDNIIKLPDLLTLAAMKAYALGRRAKWKDYVDLYFIIKQHSVDKIIKRAKQIFKDEFNEKLFKSQLSYFKDIDHSEKIVFRKGFEVKDSEVEKRLVEFTLQN